MWMGQDSRTWVIPHRQPCKLRGRSRAVAAVGYMRTIVMVYMNIQPMLTDLEQEDEGHGVVVLVLLRVYELVEGAHAGRSLQQRRLHVVREAEGDHLRAHRLVRRVAVQDLRGTKAISSRTPASRLRRSAVQRSKH